MTGIPDSAYDFKEDLFRERRNATESAGVPYNPESLISGAEFEDGTWQYPRQWPDRETYLRAVGGHLTSEEILRIAPRVKPAEAVSVA